MVRALGALLLLVAATTIGRLGPLPLEPQGAEELADAIRRSAGWR